MINLRQSVDIPAFGWHRCQGVNWMTLSRLMKRLGILPMEKFHGWKRIPWLFQLQVQ